MEFITVSESRIGKQGIWHYKAITPVGDIHLVEAEDKALGLTCRKIFDGDEGKAKSYYKQLCKKILAGKL